MAMAINGKIGMFWKVSMVLTFLMLSCSKTNNISFPSKGKINYSLTAEEEKMLDSIQYKTFQYFMNEHHPHWGAVKDRAAKWSPISIAATGFAIPCFAIGAERKWISRDEAAQITLNILKFFKNSEQSPDPLSTGYKGFYYHFLNMETGKREWKCELSSVDTGLLLMGIIFARNYYNANNSVERQIRQIADFLIKRVDWDFMQMPPQGQYAYTISMGWYPESSIHNMGWKGYNEALFLYILAAGSGMKNIEKAYNSWLESYNWYTPYKDFSHVAFPPLFGHQFSHAFIDFRGIQDSYMSKKGIDYFINSRIATYAQREYCIDNPHGWVGYDSLCWGITACDGPTDKYNFDNKVFLGYAGRGASGRELNYFDDGTIAPYGHLSSLPFAPEIVLPTTKAMLQRYGDKIWGKYGFYDSFNPTAKWVDNDFIGIDQGPMLIMIENFRTGMVWNYIMPDPIIQSGLKKLGFQNIN